MWQNNSLKIAIVGGAAPYRDGEETNAAIIVRNLVTNMSLLELVIRYLIISFNELKFVTR